MYKLIYKNRQHFSIILYIVVFVVCFALMFALLGSRKTGLFTKGDEVKSFSPENVASMTLVDEGGKQSYQVGDQVVLKLKANSLGAEITGYDALFSYDPNALEVVSVSSVKETVDIYPHPNADYVSVTGVKRITESSQLIFHNDDLVSFVVRVKKPGVTMVSLVAQKGNERTKMVDTNTNIIIPEVGPALRLNVR